MPRSAFAVVLVAASSIAACGGRSDLVDYVLGGVDAGADGHADASPIRDASPERDAPPIDAAPPPIGNYGYVMLRSYEGQRAANAAEVTAVFYQSFPLACALGITEGTCAVATCPSSDLGVGVSAGDIMFGDGTSGVSGAIHPMPAPPPNGIHYDTWPSPTPAFHEGDGIKISAAGATVPAFAAALTFPGPLTSFNPQVGAGMVTVDTTQPLALAWGATTAPELLFYLLEDGAPAATPQLICYFGSKAGQAIVPAALLQQLKAALTGSGRVFAAVFPAARTVVASPSSRVVVNALGPGIGGVVMLP